MGQNRREQRAKLEAGKGGKGLCELWAESSADLTLALQLCRKMLAQAMNSHGAALVSESWGRFRCMLSASHPCHGLAWCKHPTECREPREDTSSPTSPWEVHSRHSPSIHSLYLSAGWEHPSAESFHGQPGLYLVSLPPVSPATPSPTLSNMELIPYDGQSSKTSMSSFCLWNYISTSQSCNTCFPQLISKPRHSSKGTRELLHRFRKEHHSQQNGFRSHCREGCKELNHHLFYPWSWRECFWDD